MSLSEYIIQNEKVFASAHDIKYLFMPAERPSQYLTVVFSGFNGEEEKGKPPHYNYVKHLKDINCHRLFIIDECNGHPCYYLGNHKKLDYEASVASLIFSVINKYKIKKSNVITCGSSKGGTAAFYFGIKYDFGHVVTGGFQFFAGDYLYNVGEYTREKVLTSITGGSSTGHRDYLNNIYLDLLKYARFTTKLNLHIGRGDHHYETHFLPFLDILKEREIPFDLDVQEYESHSKMGMYFADYLLEKITKITGEIVIKDVPIAIEDNVITVSCHTPENAIKDKFVHFAFYVYKEGISEPIEKTKYSRSNTFHYKPDQSGKYTIRVFMRKDHIRLSKGTMSIIL
ncbi:hypothetical protein [Priestia megaterium]|uniref:hypothetical protein n=1 Tax=Priestia megaterium TaxID=1404 RepID=UPI003CC55F67